MAWSDFQPLARLWRHTLVPRARKIQIFQAVITCRVFYGLSGAWLNVAEQRRLDAFQSKCLRRILGIPSAYFSRVSNKVVLARAQQIPYTMQLLKQQLLLYGKVARSRDDDPLRKLIFCPGSLEPATSRRVRRVGRPRNEWAVKLTEIGISITGSMNALNNLVREAAAWRRLLNHKYKL